MMLMTPWKKSILFGIWNILTVQSNSCRKLLSTNNQFQLLNDWLCLGTVRVRVFVFAV